MAVLKNSSANLSNVTFYRNGGYCTVNLIAESSVTITECSFIQNVAAICSFETGTLNVSHSRFIQNSPIGAIIAQMTTMTLLNVTFEENQANKFGAAIYFDKFIKVTMKDCVFRNNTASLKGGALWVYKLVSISMDNCRFMGNKAEKKAGGAIGIGASAQLNMILCTLEDNTSGTDAGPIYISGGSDAVMSNCTLKGNSAGVGGGAVGLYNSNLNLHDTIFQNNSACNGDGGGILAQDNCVIKISNSLLTNNTSMNNGGAICVTNKMKLFVHHGTIFSNRANVGTIMIDRNSVMMLKDSKFYNNYGHSWGGTLVIYGNSTSVIHNCTFKGNKAELGACTRIHNSEAYFTNCTMENNVASGWGGVLHMNWVKLRITNILFLNNSAPEGKDIFIDTMANDLTNPMSSEILTYESIFKHGNITVMTTDKHFKQEALDRNMICELPGIKFAVIKTPYASGIYLSIIVIY